MEAVGILHTLQQVSFNALGTSVFFTVLAHHLFTNNRCIIVQTYRAGLRFDSGLLGLLGWHGRIRLL
jgi:hypothetical protein